MKNLILIAIINLLFIAITFAQDGHSLTLNISVSENLQQSHNPEGRLFIFINENLRGEPYNQLWPMNKDRNHIYAKNISWPAENMLTITHDNGFASTAPFSINSLPNGSYNVQVFWDQDFKESRINAPGNRYSTAKNIEINQHSTIDLTIDQIIAERTLVDHPLVKLVDIKSDTLSAWWGKEMRLKASILLPKGYHENPGSTFPVRYNVAGYGGRYTRVNRLMRNNSEFMKWWISDDAPQFINVFLDGEGPFGDSYQLDSENNGPYGYSLINELIPYIEQTYRANGDASSRFVDGCSTGGWVSLALQLFYPDHFNGVWSYSPDAIEFENYQLINVYNDKNVFVNEWGNLRPVGRDLTGDPIITMKDFIQYENVLGYTDDYTTSGGQFSAHNALYSPKGPNGTPAAMFDPVTGEIDKSVVEHWKKYDLKLVLKDNWEELGPKLEGKIYIWMGDMDNFYLNPATRAFDQFVKSTTNPKSDANIVFKAMAGHCQNFDQKEILKMMQAKIDAN